MAGVPLDDRGLLLGDGLFETILARRGELVLFDAHLNRMRAGCAAIGLAPPASDQARGLCRQVLDAAGLADDRAAVRLTLTAGSGGRGLERPADTAERLFATAAPAPAPASAAVLITATTRRNAGSPASRLKSLSCLDNVLARREALAAGADEAVMLNNEGHVAGAAAANLFWVESGRLFTPALDCGVLDGVMRGQVIAWARANGVSVEEVCAPPAALARAEAVMLTNSLIGVRSVSVLDGRALKPHAIAADLSRGLAAVS